MKKNFIGLDELRVIENKMDLLLPVECPEIPFNIEHVLHEHEDYLLILGVSQMKNGDSVNLLSLRNKFGQDPNLSEPCFYNQDWYLNEEFIALPLESKWFLIRKNVYEMTRAKNPEDLQIKYNFPSAILCAYSFFACNLLCEEILWKHDFVWCNDLDHNGDRIYVGKYIDIDGVNKNGFSIHRHLALRSCYASIEFL